MTMAIIRTRRLGSNAVPALPDPCFFATVPVGDRKFCGLFRAFPCSPNFILRGNLKLSVERCVRSSSLTRHMTGSRLFGIGAVYFRSSVSAKFCTAWPGPEHHLWSLRIINIVTTQSALEPSRLVRIMPIFTSFLGQ